MNKQKNILALLLLSVVGCNEDFKNSRDQSSQSLDMQATLNDQNGWNALPSLFIHESNDANVALFVRQVVPIDSTPPGENVAIENGYNYLIINRNCEFWVWNGTSDTKIWSSIKHGKLSNSQVTEIETDLDLLSWHHFDQKLIVEDDVKDAPVWDMNYEELSWGIQCIKCNDIVAHAKVWIQTLHQSSTPMKTEGLRLIAQHISPEDLSFFNKPTVTKPSMLDLESIAYSYRNPPHGCGQGTLINDASLIEDLLNIKEEYLNETKDNFWYQYLPLEADDGVIYKVHFREVTPFEDEQGLINLKSHLGKCF